MAVDTTIHIMISLFNSTAPVLSTSVIPINPSDFKLANWYSSSVPRLLPIGGESVIIIWTSILLDFGGTPRSDAWIDKIVGT